MLGLSSPYAVEVEDDKCLGGYVQTVQAQMDHVLHRGTNDDILDSIFLMLSLTNQMEYRSGLSTVQIHTVEKF